MMNNSAYIKTLENTIIEQNKQLESMRKQIENLNETIEWFKKQCFGSTSEKTHRKELSNQLSMFDEAEVEADSKSEEPGFATPSGKARIRKSCRKDKFVKNIEVLEIPCRVAPEDLFCEECGTPLKIIGKETVREEIEFIPAKLRILKYVSFAYECPKCKHTDNPYIIKSIAPTSVMNHSLASPSSVAYVIYQKYVNSVPLYRQEKDWENMGLILSRATMANWIIRCSEDYFIALVNHMHEILLKREIIHADETVIQVLKEEGKTAQSKSYMWLYRSGNDGLAPIIIYDYKSTRNGDNAVEFLGDFKGFLQTDGYAGYNKLINVTRVGCLAHVRRKFIEACPSMKAADNPTVAEKGVDYCNRIFNIERELKDLSVEERYTRRLEQVKPVLNAFWCWLNKQNPINGGKLNKAINYAIEQKQNIENYLLDGRCSVSNNLAENSIRPFTIGRKNWLFSDTTKGAHASAAVYSLVETAKANNVKVFSYIKYVLTHMPGSEWQRCPEYLEELMPWSESVKAVCAE